MLRIKLLHCAEQTLVANGDQLGKIQSVPLVFLDIRDHEAKIRRHETLGGRPVALLGEPRYPLLFCSVFYEGKLLDILEVLIKGARYAGSEKCS